MLLRDGKGVLRLSEGAVGHKLNEESEVVVVDVVVGAGCTVAMYALAPL